MPLRLLLRYLGDQHLVERLANSTVIRRFAQLTHYSYLKATSWGNKSLDKMSETNKLREQGGQPNTTGRLVSFTRKFLNNLQKEIEDKQTGRGGPYR